MAGLVSTGNSLFFLLAYVTILASATNNTTQFGNFTIEWEDFSLFNCSEPAILSFSRFTCLPRAGYAMVQDISCLTETTIDFDQNTCQATTSASTLTTVTLMTTQSNTVKQTQTSASITTVTTRITTVRTDTATTAKLTATISTTQSAITSQAITTARKNTTASTPGSVLSTNTTVHTNTTASTLGSVVSTNTTVYTNTTTSTPGSVVSTNTTVHTNTTTSTPGSVVSTSTAVTSEGTTEATSMTTNSTSVSSTTTISTSPYVGNIFGCNGTYIGVFCNVSADACVMSQPCLNAATCFPNNSLPFGYRCECPDGFIGYDCEVDEHSCLSDTCWHNGTCIPVNSSIPSYNGSNFRCECILGYNGVYCELKINLCDEITCENRGMCQTVDSDWQCLCLDPTLYYGEYCQFKSGTLRLHEILSKSFAAVAIGAIVTTCSFVVVMDVLKYAFHIDPVERERDSYRRRRELQRQARQPPKTDHPRIALRFQYVT